jgi:uncharacterized protein
VIGAFRRTSHYRSAWVVRGWCTWFVATSGCRLGTTSEGQSRKEDEATTEIQIKHCNSRATRERDFTMEATTARPSRTTMTSAFPLKYIVIAFAFTWFFWALALLEARGLISSLPVPATFLGAFGPMVAAVVVTTLESGRAGLRALLSRVVRWRVAPIWYGVALLGPIVLALGAMALHVVLGGQPPNPQGMIGALPTVLFLFGYMFIQVGIGEEIGWRGYALPKLQAGYSALVSSVILGLIWSLWHLPLFFDPTSPYSRTPFWAFLIFMVAISILITWVFNSTGGSTLMIMILHAMLNAAIGPLWAATPEYSTAIGNTNIYLLQASLLWVGVIVVVLVYGASNLSRKSREVLPLTIDESQPRVQ